MQFETASGCWRGALGFSNDVLLLRWNVMRKERSSVGRTSNTRFKVEEVDTSGLAVFHVGHMWTC
jgi:hypothetical protein